MNETLGLPRVTLTPAQPGPEDGVREKPREYPIRKGTKALIP